ncbi:MAG TPA: radical SAM protein [Vicinamibacteria bacterium]|nr:radical SAM protein [Vicinamibacteria bacterium]
MANPRVLDFKDHRRELDANRYVYAVVSRRASGLSIGVNLNPDKVCNFDCPYCQVDRTTPGSAGAVDVEALKGELVTLLDEVAAGRLWERPPFDSTAPALRRVADIAFSGDGEPTTPAEFPQAARAARAARDSRGLSIPIRLITNATMFDRPRVRAALALFDELWCKLDAGTEGYFRLMDGTRFPFDRVLANLLAVARERPIVIQAMFLAWEGHGPSSEEIGAWVGRLEAIRDGGGAIDLVQVYTVARRPADARVAALEPAAVEAIAARAREAGFRAEPYA